MVHAFLRTRNPPRARYQPRTPRSVRQHICMLLLFEAMIRDHLEGVGLDQRRSKSSGAGAASDLGFDSDYNYDYQRDSGGLS